MLQKPVGDLGLVEHLIINDVVALYDLVNGFDKPARGDIFGEISGGPCPNGMEDLLIVVIGCEHYDCDVRHHTFQLTGYLESVHPRQVDIHNHDVRDQLFGHTQRLIALGHFDNDLHVRLGFQDSPQALSEEGMIIYQH